MGKKFYDRDAMVESVRILCKEAISNLMMELSKSHFTEISTGTNAKEHRMARSDTLRRLTVSGRSSSSRKQVGNTLS